MKHFDQDITAAYDADIRSRIPGYDHLLDLISAVLDVEVPSPAHILIAGSGTGEEVKRVVRRHPDWKINSDEQYDVALSVFVSQFIPDDGRKKEFFQKISGQLHPGAPFIFMDLMKQHDLVGEKLIACNYFWAKAQGLETAKLKQLPSRLRELFHPVTEERMEEILAEVGLNLEGRFAQSLGFCGYVARKFST